MPSIDSAMGYVESGSVGESWFEDYTDWLTRSEASGLAGAPQVFEQPLSKRIRTFLRLEYLFARLAYHRADRTHWGRRATLDVLLDLLTVLAGFNVNSELSKALGQWYSQLEALRDNTGDDDNADHATIDDRLSQVDDLGRRIQTVPTQVAAYLLRDDALLYNLNNRNPIAGGSCGFDLPAYQYWLAQPDERIEADLEQWTEHFDVFESAVELILHLLREGTDVTSETAHNGICIYKTPRSTQMIRVLLDETSVFPQISAGRHRATIRFMTHVDDSTRVRQTGDTFDFRMACCS